jgi:putative transport protein
VSRHLGDSERGPGDLNPVGLSIGMAAGLLLGLVPLPSPAGGTFALGAAAGPLIAGLVLGHRARTGPVVWSLPYTASQLLQQLGILIFLATAGSRAGGDLVMALRGGEGLDIAIAGLVVTAVAAIALVVLARALKLGGPRLAGLVAGAQTQPAVLAFAQERTGGDQRVAVGYALVFPAAMITKIVAAALLVTLGSPV